MFIRKIPAEFSHRFVLGMVRVITRNGPYTTTLAIIMKNTILILILIFTIGLNAQDLTKSEFKKTEWFANNENRNFYESETIKLIRIQKFKFDKEKLNEVYIKIERNENKNITELNFKRSGKLIVEDLNIENWDVTKLVGKWKWKFDSKRQILKLFFNRKLHSAFRIESKNIEKSMWNESELELLVLNLIRLRK